MTPNITVVKRAGQRPSEHFDHDKLKKSIIAACLSVKTPKGEAQDTADRVYNDVVKWCSDKQKQEVTSDDIRRVAAESLNVYHSEAAYLYKHHRLVL